MGMEAILKVMHEGQVIVPLDSARSFWAIKLSIDRLSKNREEEEENEQH